MSADSNQYVDHLGRKNSVRNENRLAAFLRNLKNSGGALTEDLTCTVDGGVGGVPETTFYEAGTTLELIIRELLTGVPALSLSTLILKDGATVIATGESGAYAAGTNVSVTNITFVISDSEGLVTTETGTFVPGSSLADETGVTLVEGANAFDNTDVTYGATTSDAPFSWSNAFETKTIKIEAVASDGTNLMAQKQLRFAQPAFLLNCTNSLAPGAIEPAFAALIPTLFAAPTRVSFVTKVQATTKYNSSGVQFSNVETGWGGQPAGSISHFFCIPAAAGATPTGFTGYQIGGNSATGDFTDLGTHNLDLYTLGLSTDAGATAVPYLIGMWNTQSAITDQNAITFL